VLIVPTPLKVSEINSTQLQKEIVTSGCCGELEMIKYEAYKLTEYSKIILLDSDVILTKPHALTKLVNKLDTGTKLIYNFDRTMASTKEKDDCVSAGFLVFKPSVEEYHFFVDLVKSGRWDGNGWVGSHMGYCYGGPTVQGLMAYYRFKLCLSVVVFIYLGYFFFFFFFFLCVCMCALIACMLFV
jgi:hypothetical protein